MVFDIDDIPISHIEMNYSDDKYTILCTINSILLQNKELISTKQQEYALTNPTIIDLFYKTIYSNFPHVLELYNNNYLVVRTKVNGSHFGDYYYTIFNFNKYITYYKT
jgi:hypothetical protein